MTHDMKGRWHVKKKLEKDCGDLWGIGKTCVKKNMLKAQLCKNRYIINNLLTFCNSCEWTFFSCHGIVVCVLKKAHLALCYSIMVFLVDRVYQTRRVMSVFTNFVYP